MQTSNAIQQFNGNLEARLPAKADCSLEIVGGIFTLGCLAYNAYAYSYNTVQFVRSAIHEYRKNKNTYSMPLPDQEVDPMLNYLFQSMRKK